MKTRHAFTLIEMLVVIAIIGIIAALVVNMNAKAQNMKRRAQVDADKHTLLLSIDSYQAKLNYYPPDNGALVSNTLTPNYDLYSATNPLLYELTGATNYLAAGSIVGFDGTNLAANYLQCYNRSAVNNANVDEPHSFFRPVPGKYASYNSLPALKGLVVPVPAATDPTAQNFWHYDSSTTNRHNLGSFDLWAEFIVGSKDGAPLIVTNGNW